MKLFLSLFASIFILISMNALAVQPTTQAYNIAFNNVSTNQVRVVFSRGDGAYRIVVGKQTSDPTTITSPTDGNDYNANATFGSGSDLGSSSFVLYEGTARAVTVTGLTAGLPYSFKVYEFNGTGEETDYLTVSASNNPRTIYTVPAAISNLTVTNKDNNSFDANWNAPGGDGYDSYQLEVATDAAFTTFVPDYDGIYVGTESDPNPFYTVEDLDANSSYYWRVRTVNDGRFGTWAVFGTPTAVVTNPEAPVVANGNICSGETFTLTPTSPAPLTHSFKFYTSFADESSLVATGASYTTPSLTATTTYYVASVNTATGLESATKTAVTVNVAAYPDPEITGDDTVCAGVTDVVYSTPATAGNSYEWTITGGTITAGANTNSITVTWGTDNTGSLEVTESNPTGCETSADFDIAIQTVPAPVITGSANVCANATAVSYSIPATTNNLVWEVTGGSIDSGQGTAVITVNWDAAGEGTIEVTESTTGGCVTTAEYDVTIQAFPATDLTGLNLVCSSQQDVAYTTPAHEGNTYAWTVEGGTLTTGETANSIVVDWGAEGTGKVMVSETSALGCISYDTVIVLINPIANTNITGSLSVCAGQTDAVYAVEQVLEGNEFEWTVTGGTITDGQGTSQITVNWGTAGTGSVAIEETMPSGCSSSHSHDVTINALPVSSISGSNSVCGNSTESYSVTSTEGHIYLWNVTGGTISGDNNTNTINVNWGAEGTGVVSLVETNTNGCSNTVNASVEINPLPMPEITGNAFVCVNSANEVYSVEYTEGNTYTWEISGGIVTDSTASSLTVTWNTAGDKSITVTEETEDGCEASSTMTISVEAYPEPVIAGEFAICAGSIETYSVAFAEDNEYHWIVTGGTIRSGENTNEITVEWTNAGNGLVEIVQITPAGCSRDTSSEVSVFANPAPSITGDNEVLEYDANIPYSTPMVEGNTYEWTVTGGTITSGENTAAITVDWNEAGEGKVEVTETNANGCIVSNSIDVNISRGTLAKLAFITNIDKMVSGTPITVTVQSQTSNGTPTTVTVNTPIAIAINTGNGVVTGNGTILAGRSETNVLVTYTLNNGDPDVVLSVDDGPGGLSAGLSNVFDVLAFAPNQSTYISWGTVTSTSINLRWTSGTGAGRIVVAKQYSSFTSNDVAVDGTGYTANTEFGRGDQIGGAYVVYNGTGNSVTVTGLNPTTRYWFKVLDYNGSAVDGTINYNNNTVSANPRSRYTARISGSEFNLVNENEEGSIYMSQVSPNPATDKVSFEIGFGEETTYSVSVLTLDGRTVLSPVNYLTASKGIAYPVEFSVDNLAAGNYIIMITAGDETMIDKFIVLP